MLEAEAEVEDKSSRPRPRPRPKIWPRGQLVLEDLTSLVIENHNNNFKFILIRPIINIFKGIKIKQLSNDKPRCKSSIEIAFNCGVH